eukprot:Pgem_evm1s14508
MISLILIEISTVSLCSALLILNVAGHGTLKTPHGSQARNGPIKTEQCNDIAPNMKDNYGNYPNGKMDDLARDFKASKYKGDLRKLFRAKNLDKGQIQQRTNNKIQNAPTYVKWQNNNADNFIVDHLGPCAIYTVHEDEEKADLVFSNDNCVKDYRRKNIETPDLPSLCSSSGCMMEFYWLVTGVNSGIRKGQAQYYYAAVKLKGTADANYGKKVIPTPTTPTTAKTASRANSNINANSNIYMLPYNIPQQNPSPNQQQLLNQPYQQQYQQQILNQQPYQQPLQYQYQQQYQQPYHQQQYQQQQYQQQQYQQQLLNQKPSYQQPYQQLQLQTQSQQNAQQFQLPIGQVTPTYYPALPPTTNYGMPMASGTNLATNKQTKTQVASPSLETIPATFFSSCDNNDNDGGNNKKQLGIGSYTFQQLNSYMTNIAQISVSPSFTVTLYNQDNFKGNSITLVGGINHSSDCYANMFADGLRSI